MPYGAQPRTGGDPLTERAGRSAGRPADQRRRTVAVTGATGPVARLLLERLLADPTTAGVVLVDPDQASLDVLVRASGPRRRGAPVVRPVALDSTDPRLAAELPGCDVVVHLDPDPVRQQLPGPRPEPPAPTHGGVAADPTPGPVDGDAADPSGPGRPDLEPDELEPLTPAPSGRTIRAAQTVLTAAAAAGVARVVLVTSAMVYGPDVGIPLDEDGPVAADPVGPVLRDMLEVERVAAAVPRTHPGLGVAVVRPAALVGPGVDTLVTRHFEAPRLLTLRGVAMRWQFCHLADLVGALAAVATGELVGSVTVGSTGWLAQEEVQRLSGTPAVELPESLAFGTAQRLHRLGLTPAPAGELRYVTRPWVVPSTRLRDAGWRPGWDNAEAFTALLAEARGRTALAGRRIGRRETATLGAAGATVAVLGTAAIVRRARRARRSG